MEYLIIGGIIIFIGGLIYYFKFYLKSTRKNEILNELKIIFDDKNVAYEILPIKRGWCDFKVELNDTIYYFKMFVIPGREEVVINSKYMWQVHGGSRGFLFLNGVKPFIDGPMITTTKITKKVAIFYPFCENVMYYLNESDMDFVIPKTLVHGVKVISFNELAEKFNWL